MPTTFTARQWAIHHLVPPSHSPSTLHALVKVAEFVVGDSESRRQIDNQPEGSDKNAFGDKTLSQRVEILDALKLDHADGAADADIANARKCRDRAQAPAASAREIAAT